MLDVVFLGVSGSVQTMESGNTSILVSTEKAKVLVDTSVNVFKAVKCDLDAVFLTHEHTDHIYALPSLIHQLWLTGRAEGLDIVVPRKMTGLVNSLIDLFSFRAKKGMFPLNIREDSELVYGDLSIRTFESDHTGTSMGMVFSDGTGKIVYTSDTRPINRRVEAFMDADLLIHEASGVSADEEVLVRKGHSSARDAATLASLCNVRKLFLCHLPAEGALQVLDEARQGFENVCIPEVLSGYSIPE